jgi:hypothetical protein
MDVSSQIRNVTALPLVKEFVVCFWVRGYVGTRRGEEKNPALVGNRTLLVADYLRYSLSSTNRRTENDGWIVVYLKTLYHLQRF